MLRLNKPLTGGIYKINSDAYVYVAEINAKVIIRGFENISYRVTCSKELLNRLYILNLTELVTDIFAEDV